MVISVQGTGAQCVLGERRKGVEIEETLETACNRLLNAERLKIHTSRAGVTNFELASRIQTNFGNCNSWSLGDEFDDYCNTSGRTW